MQSRTEARRTSSTQTTKGLSVLRKLLGVDWFLFDYQHVYGNMPDCHRFIEQGTTSGDRVITFGRWQVIVSRQRRK